MEKNKNAYNSKAGLLKVMVFFAALLMFSLVSVIIPLRPDYSDVEKRNLSEFPKFSISTFMSGEYFRGISTWFSDTFPFRESLISASAKLMEFGGNNDVHIYGEVEDADAIPDTPNKGNTSGDPAAPAGTSPSPSSKPPETSDPAAKSNDAELGEAQSMGAIVVLKDSAYEYYSFSREQSDRYIEVVDKAAARLEGRATVYDIIVPNSMGVMLPDNYKDKVKSSDQKAAIDYMFGSMDKKVKAVPILSTLMAHRDEYLYFRTDHHWTALGAYYAYTQFAKTKGLEPTPLGEFETKEFPGYLGTFYASAKMPAAMTENPDTVYAYIPKGTNEMTYWDRDGNSVKWAVITDVTSWSATTKYNAFAAGDQPLSVIENPSITDGSACVVVKESYGNAFVPFLVDNYQKVFVVDYRYYQGTLSALVDEQGIQDVIFVNNIMATSTKGRIDDMDRIIG